MFFDSTAETSVACRSCLLRFFPLLDSKWLLKPLFLLTLPLPVTLKRFIAALLLFILGTFSPFTRLLKLAYSVWLMAYGSIYMP